MEYLEHNLNNGKKMSIIKITIYAAYNKTWLARRIYTIL